MDRWERGPYPNRFKSYSRVGDAEGVWQIDFNGFMPCVVTFFLNAGNLSRLRRKDESWLSRLKQQGERCSLPTVLPLLNVFATNPGCTYPCTGTHPSYVSNHTA